MSLFETPDAVPARCSAPDTTNARSSDCPLVRGELDLELDCRHAGRRRLVLRYQVLGARQRPAVFVAGGISADRHLTAHPSVVGAGWWDAQVGTGRAIDPARHCVLSIDWLGADGALDAVIDPSDQADAIAALLDALRIPRLHAFVGCSYGAMVGLQVASRHPRRVGHLVAISGTHRAHPYASAWRALQRRAVALGALQCDESHGLALARQLAILSYRTPEEFDARFGAAQVAAGTVRVAAEAYLDHCGAKYAQRTAAVAFTRLSESIDLQDVAPETITAPVTVVAVRQDRLVPLDDARRLAERLRGETRVHVLESVYGHDAFLKEVRAIDAILRDVLAPVAQGVAA